MSERLAVLCVALLLELLGGLGLRNETVACRGRIEADRRRADTCTQRQQYVDSLFHEITAPSNLERLEQPEKTREVRDTLPAL